MIITIAGDSEYLPEDDKPTIPICLTYEDREGNQAFYIHPNAPKDVLVHAEKIGDKIFKRDFAILDFFEDIYGYEVGYSKGFNYKNYVQSEIVIFFSFKDVEFQFKNKEDYSNLVLKKLSRTRRISVKNLINSPSGSFISDSIGLPYTVRMPDPLNGGKMRVFKLSLKITDIAAMQGIGGLKEYASNVGIVMGEKDTYTPEEKKRMDLRYIENHLRFKPYAMGDTKLIQIKTETDKFYNRVAELIGIETRDSWGMSTGKIVASMLNMWLCKQVGCDSESLYRMQNLAGSEGITNLSKLIKEKSLVYAAMVDGGRTVKERDIDVLIGNLIDSDVDSCYGNGLKNQSYPIGIPSITAQRMILGDWLNKNQNEFVPGLWSGRISWDNATFKQDVLITKEDKPLQTWNWVIEGIDSQGFDIDDDGKKVYDASMCLTTNSIKNATLNHDSLQLLKSVSSIKEWSWLLKNAYIESSLIYKKSDRVDSPNPEMLEGVTLSDDPEVFLGGSKKWVSIDLKPLMTLLINERKKYPKKTSMNVFLKVIINTIYGCIASEFFSVNGSCVSNVVCGNNITARVRAMVWCMAKGLYTAMIVTDGGVFDVNNVIFFKKKSLNLLEGLHRGIMTDGKNKFCYTAPLMGFELNFKDSDWCELMLNKLGLVPDTDTKINRARCLKIINDKCIEHLTNIFDIDIFKYNQFSLDIKDIYVKLILHSKVDYLLERPNGTNEIAYRGMPKVWDDKLEKKVFNPIALELFKAIEDNIPIKREVDGTEMLSLSDYRIKIKKDVNYPLLPHDTVSKPMTFYSHSPGGCRVKDLSELKKIERRYQTAKKSDNSIKEVANVKRWGDKLQDQ